MQGIRRAKSFVGRVPVVGPILKAIYTRLQPRQPFTGSMDYWEYRYRSGGNSGSGSYNRLAEFKAEVINEFVARNGIESVIEFGCGDGNQLTLARYRSYVGFDVSDSALERCQNVFSSDPTKKFKSFNTYSGETAELAMSLDVIYHIVENSIFELYMGRLFSCAQKYVIIYSSNDEGLNHANSVPHVRHRRFTDWIALNAREWKQTEYIPNKYPYDFLDQERTSLADFYIFGRQLRAQLPA